MTEATEEEQSLSSDLESVDTPEAAVLTQQGDVSAPDSGFDAESFDLGAPDLAAALEALLIIADQPMTVEEMAAVTGVPADEVDLEVRRLASEYTESGRGFDLREASGGWRFYTRAECSDLVSRYITEGQTARLSQAALETLAVIAYRQPVSRARISAVRGVNVDGVVRTLMTRGLVEQVGTEAESGAGLYGTTGYFLERLGLVDISELPPLAEHVPMGEVLSEIIETNG